MVRGILVFFAVLLLLSSCERIYINGDLDGLWKLEMVKDGEECEHPGNIFYSFQRHLVMFGEYYEEGAPEYYMGEFDKSGDRIVMTKFHEYPGLDTVCDMEKMKKYYIFSDTMLFIVDRLDDDVLLMHTSKHEYNFRKW